jgi:hypothetical protein
MDTGAIGGFGGVEGALRRAASATGVDFDFLMRTARRESGLNPSARAPTSSAAGLFQFVDQTWLAMVKRHGAKHGLGRWAGMIDQGADGRFRVADGGARRAVLNLRYDPQLASLMAGELASDHAAYLRGRTGREPSAGELYAAHFLGPAGAARLIEAVQSRPGAAAASLFPDAAQANRSIFYRDGRPATVSEVYANLTRTGGEGPALAPGSTGAIEETLDPRDLAIARRLDRLKRESAILGFLKEGSGMGGGSLIEAQLLSGFGPDTKE